MCCETTVIIDNSNGTTNRELQYIIKLEVTPEGVYCTDIHGKTIYIRDAKISYADLLNHKIKLVTTKSKNLKGGGNSFK